MNVLFLPLIILSVSIGIEASSKSCLTELTGQQCADIQDAGDKLSRHLREADSVIQEIIYRCIGESQLIIESSMKYLKSEASKVTINYKGKTPIETNALQQAVVDINVVALYHLREGNREFWEIIKKLSKTQLKDDIVSSEILSYKSKGKRSASMNSINGVVLSVKGDVKNILLKVDVAMKDSAKKMFNVFAESLKLVIAGILPIDIDQVKLELEKYLSDNMNVVIESILNHASLILKEIIQELERVDSMVTPLKSDSNRLKRALEPARTLVLEVLEMTQNNDLNKEVGRKIQEGGEILKKYFDDIKNNVAKF